jgi:hypothetical protein
VTTEQRFYILVRNGLGAAFVNALLNGAIGWGITRGLSEFPTWKAPGVAVDLVFTAFGITFGTCVVLPAQIRRDFEHGRASLPEIGPRLSAIIARFPKGFFARAALLGLVSVPLFAPPALLGLAVYGAASLERVAFVELKAVFSAIQGGLVTPLIVLAVLSALSERKIDVELPRLTPEAP